MPRAARSSKVPKPRKSRAKAKPKTARLPCVAAAGSDKPFPSVGQVPSGRDPLPTQLPRAGGFQAMLDDIDPDQQCDSDGDFDADEW